MKKKYSVSLSPNEIELLRDCINFQFQMSGYDDPLNWEQIAEDKQTINKLINMDDKLKDIIPLKDFIDEDNSFIHVINSGIFDVPVGEFPWAGASKE